ncbi:MAG: MazG nucleotide pyrophosphohydrolase domain-containing protein [Pseudomonadota bacterium]
MSDDPLVLPPQATLADLQSYVIELERQRGFDDQSVIDKCLLMGEEMGELFKAVRTAEGLKIDVPGGEVADELADVLIFLCSIANRYDVDLEAAFRAKEAVNKQRVWK